MFNLPIAPEQASEFAKQYDLLFWATTALTVFFTTVVLIMVLGFAIRYRKGAKVNRKNAPTSHMLLEATWTVIPLVLGVMMFFWAAKLFVDARVPPKDAMDIYVIGKQWMWHIQHPNGVRENNTLHVPVGKPVRLIMISQDVLHSFFIPQFRTKQDVIPGRYTLQWFTATKPGKYNLFCAEYCGTQHSEMGGYVYVMEPSEYEAWLANEGTKIAAANRTPVANGKRLWDQFRCGSCHGPQDSLEAPSLFNWTGTAHPIADGSTANGDLTYFRESLLDPYRRLTRGYGKTMPDYGQQLSEDQVLELFAYVQTLGAAPEKLAVTKSEADAQGGESR
ncbi:MAG: cytochrome c oxidase subunit II [Fimbriimonadaceae bacterium]|nr:cytochrome c oxidase subunit 2 [Fimbriimonadaceae bacterium]MCL4284343.1 cytochrome c oxidase subunit II [Fimbriimonadaceae bacterium]QOJ11157.1 MAG: cytochrome c oxidase subunit II [Chthonomonadaceae bacterium]